MSFPTRQFIYSISGHPQMLLLKEIYFPYLHEDLLWNGCGKLQYSISVFQQITHPNICVSID